MPEQLTLQEAARCQRGRLFVFEGVDGVGKSTLSQLFIEHLRRSHLSSELISFPGNESGTLGRHIYEIHHRPDRFGVISINPTSLQLLHVAAHLDTIEKRIRPALDRGTSIVLDRYWWSTWVYGLITGVPRASLKAMVDLERTHWGSALPDAVFLVRRPSPLQAGHDLKRWLTLDSEYQECASEEMKRQRVHIIRNTGTSDDALKQVTQAVSDLLEHRAEDQSITCTTAVGVRTNQRPPYGLTVVSRLSPAKPTIVYDTYWRFAAERQEVFFRKFEGKAPPWTEDPIIQKYKFTNAYRASDRVSQFFIRRVIYDGDQTPNEVFFRTILFKLFNRIETWELIKRECGQVCWKDYTFARFDSVLTRALARGTRIYSAAYIMPPVHGFGTKKKHQGHLKLLELMMTTELPARVADARSMRQVFDLLRSCPGLGDFLSYQYAIDLNYGPITNFSEMEFVVPGPGAREGIRKCFETLGGLNEVEIIRLVAERQSEEFQRLGIRFRSLWGRPLQLIDCQNLFCEVDKYSRMAHPSIKGRAGRTRIKQVYRPKETPMDYWFPPKWQLNIG